MAIIIAGSGYSTPGAYDDVVAAPGDIQDGDVLVCQTFAYDVTVAPAGWTLIEATDNFNFTAGFYKVVTDASAEPATYTFTNLYLAGITCFRGVDPETPLDTSATVNNTRVATPPSPQTYDLPALTTASDNALLICGLATTTDSNASQAITYPAGMTEVWVINEGQMTARLATQPISTHGTTVPVSVVGPCSFEGGWLIALRPVATSEPPARITVTIDDITPSPVLSTKEII